MMYKLSELLKISDSNFSFLSLLQNKWDEIHNKTDVFRYKIGTIQEKTLGCFIMQLNPNRSSKRRIPELINNICQPFNKDKFNFTQVSREEIIFNIICDDDSNEFHSILVNVSPISQYHSLLCPYVNKCLPQIVTAPSLELVIKLMFIAGDQAFRIGFNSLCALASVNHLHYHLFVENNILPVETVKCRHICGPVYCLLNYPVSAFCYQIKNGDNISEKSVEIFKLIEYFLMKSIAHNMLMTKGTDLEEGNNDVLRILVWPRKSSAGAKQLEAFNVAVCELSGWFPVYRSEDFITLQRDDLENELRKWQIDDFDLLCNEIKLLYSYFYGVLIF